MPRSRGATPSPGASGARRAVFVDRDGTVNVDVGYLVRREDVVFLPGAPEALAALTRLGLAVIVATNQSGVGRGLLTDADLTVLHELIRERLAAHGARIDAFYYCPHVPPDLNAGIACDCRKPAPGLLLQAARDHAIDLTRSYLVGNEARDIAAGRRAGCRTILVLTGSGRDHVAAAHADLVAPDLAGAVRLIAHEIREGTP